MLLRAESVASSRIEGLEVGSRRLFRAAAAREAGAEVADVTATEILGNIDAMVWAIEAVGSGVENHAHVVAHEGRRERCGVPPMRITRATAADRCEAATTVPFAERLTSFPGTSVPVRHAAAGLSRFLPCLV